MTPPTSSLAIEISEALETGRRLAVVKAPPGSGKTHLLLGVMDELVATYGRRVAVAAQTNAQADDICRRLATEHPGVPACRLASSTHRLPQGWPASVAWFTRVGDTHPGPGVVVATTAKWALTDVAEPFDVLAVDEAWQMAWADFMQCAPVSEAFVLIGDPGQIPPVVTIDVRRWETSPRAPHLPAPQVVLNDPAFREQAHLAALSSCRRLPRPAVDFVVPFYDFGFEAVAPAGARRVEVQGAPGGLSAALAALSDGEPVVGTIPTAPGGPPLEADAEVATTASRVVEALLAGGAHASTDAGDLLPLQPADIGLVSTHRAMNAVLTAHLRSDWLASGLRVDTPERWQGLERPVLVAVHPLSGVTRASDFDLETGRLCVMSSRHRAGLIVLARDHVGETLRGHIPSAEQAPGRPDVAGRGHDAHLRFWELAESRGRIFSLDG